MNTFRFSEEQRIIWVHEKYTGAKSVKKICKEAGISRATLYNWMKEIPRPEGMEAADEEEQKASPETLQSFPKHDRNSKYEMLLTAISQIDPEHKLKRKLVQSLVKRFTLTVAQACAIAGIEEELYGYKPRKPEVDDTLVYDELTRLIHEDLSRGFIQCYGIVQQTHPEWTRKQLKRVYRDYRLYLKRSRIRKDKIARIEVKPVRLFRPDTTWNAGLIKTIINQKNTHNEENINTYWILYITDEQDGKVINATIGSGDPAEEDLVYLLSLAVVQNGKPRKLKVPGIPPFNTREMTKWMLEYKVGITTLSLAKPENESWYQLLNQSVAGTLPEINDENKNSITESWLRSF